MTTHFGARHGVLRQSRMGSFSHKNKSRGLEDLAAKGRYPDLGAFLFLFKGTIIWTPGIQEFSICGMDNNVQLYSNIWSMLHGLTHMDVAQSHIMPWENYMFGVGLKLGKEAACSKKNSTIQDKLLITDDTD